MILNILTQNFKVFKTLIKIRKNYHENNLILNFKLIIKDLKFFQKK